MERRDLEKLDLAELTALAETHGLAVEAEETAEELIERLSAAPRKKEARALRPPRTPSRGTFDIPSSTVHPHAGEMETLTMARRYLAENQLTRAIEILEKLSLHDPDDDALAGELAAARKLLPPPPIAAASPPTSPSAAQSPSAPSEPLFMLDLEELPETYDVDECEVLCKDPWWVFAYWEVTDRGLDGARAQLGPSAGSARLVLRLFTTLSQGAEVHREVHDIDLSGRHGRRYLPSVKPGVHLRVAIGLLSPEGYFAPIAHSSLQRIPYAEAAPPGPVEWMEVVPGRTRGQDREPLVIVRRSYPHDERWLAGQPGTQPDKPPPGSSGGLSDGTGSK